MQTTEVEGAPELADALDRQLMELEVSSLYWCCRSRVWPRLLALMSIAVTLASGSRSAWLSGL